MAMPAAALVCALFCFQGILGKPIDKHCIDYPEECGELYEGDIMLPPGGRSAMLDLSKLWPNGVIPYQLDASYTSTQRARFQSAIDVYDRETCIRWVPRSTEAAYVDVKPKSGCSSYVGRLRSTTPQDMSLVPNCFNSLGTIIHEMMHASGFEHEQKRYDRDDYVEILWDNISSGHAFNFDRDTTSDINLMGVPYDYGSVMHYSKYAFSTNGQPTIRTKNGASIGQRSSLSDYDKFKLNKMYSCPGFTGTVPPTVLPGPTSLPFSCNFENSMCGMTWASDDDFDWMRNQATTPTSNTGPSNDHTTGTDKGFYIYMETSTPRAQGDKARLNSPVITNSGSLCLSFYYHMFGADMGSLNAYVRSGSSEKQVFTKSGDQGDQWNLAQADISSTGNIQIVIEGIVGASYFSDIAIDDVSINVGTCSGNPVPTQAATTPSTTAATTTVVTPAPSITGLPYTCSFDDVTQCAVVQETTDDFDWTNQSGSTPSSGTGPTSGATGSGKYMFIEASSPRVQGQVARLASPMLKMVSPACVSFSYHMFGSGTGDLSVSLRSSTKSTVLFSKSGAATLDQWYREEVDVSFGGLAQIVFTGTTGSSWQGDMAVDELSVTIGKCTNPSTTPAPTSAPSTVFSCNFETDICGLTQNTNDVLDWTRKQGSTPSGNTGPDSGYGGSGYYMFVEASHPAVVNDTASLTTPTFSLSDKTCVTYRSHMYGTTMGYLTVFLKIGNSEYQMSRKGGPSSDRDWTTNYLTVTFTGSAAFVFQGEVGSGYMSDMALDSIEITPGECIIPSG